MLPGQIDALSAQITRLTTRIEELIATPFSGQLNVDSES
jgi:hypothetical protein